MFSAENYDSYMQSYNSRSVFYKTDLEKVMLYSPCSNIYTLRYHYILHDASPQNFIFILTLVIHAVHDGHESFQSSQRLSLVSFRHEVSWEARYHSHDLIKRTHLHDILKLFIHVAKSELT